MSNNLSAEAEHVLATANFPLRNRSFEKLTAYRNETRRSIAPAVERVLKCLRRVLKLETSLVLVVYG